MSRLPHIVNGSLFALLIGGSLWVYPSLPEDIPRHFGFYGRADAYWATTLLRWLLLPIVAAFSGGVVYGAAWLIGRAPDAITVPNQGQYEQLSAADKRVVAAGAQRAVFWMTAPLFVVLGAVQVGIYHVATTPATALPPAVMGAMGGGICALLAIAAGLSWWMHRCVQQGGKGDETS